MSVPQIACIGDVNIDLVSTPVEQIVPEVSEEVVFTERVGGNAANTAIACSRLGLESLLVGRIGSDHWGVRLKEMLDGYDVATALRSIEGRTALTVAVTFTGGKRSFLGDQGETNETVAAEDVPEEALRGRYVMRAGYWYTPAIMGEPTARIFSRSQANGAVTLLDVGWDHLGWTEDRLDGLFGVLEHTDVLFVNELEAVHIAQMPGCDPADAARSILGHGVNAVVLHLGENGSRFISLGEDVTVPVVRAGGMRDPTGTGDVFNAAFIYAHHEGMSTEDTLRFANAAAGLHLAGHTFPSRKRVEALLALEVEI
ncbi:MAG: carbohydrate kinase family protein [Methanopyri archaeon]|nr:carbohydrate kinase family protein [Methanopyri archaeon]